MWGDDRALAQPSARAPFAHIAVRLLISFDWFPPFGFETARTSSALIIAPMETDLMPYIKGGEAQSALAWASSSPCSSGGCTAPLPEGTLAWGLCQVLCLQKHPLNHVLLSYSFCVGHSRSV